MSSSDPAASAPFDPQAQPLVSQGGEAQLLSRRYAPRSQAYDEMVDPEGAFRPAWRHFAAIIDELGAAELVRRWEQARDLIHEHGVSFNVYGDAQGLDRPWQLSPLPVLVAPDEFAALSRGLTQRAALLDRLLADLYGPRRCLSEGWLPPELVLGHPGFLRPCVGVRPPGGRWLHLYGADLIRVPSGGWQVLVDRTQAPSGAGYALENRIVVSRVLAEAFRSCNVQRLALFFRTMRESLSSLAPRARDNPRIVLLSPGPFNATYFEQAFLAQYLGFQLVEAADLTVRDGRVWLRTLGGLHQVDVILRRLNDDYCDPLELRAESTLGIPGLLEAVRTGGVAVANALGSGICQTTVMAPFLPVLCRGLLGEDLALPSVPAYWCGDRDAREHVLANLDRMVVRPAFPTGATRPVFGERLSAADREALAGEIRAQPGSFVAQERMLPSTTPMIAGDALDSRPLVLRTFLTARAGGDPIAAGAGGYEVMPGGLSLVAGNHDDLEISVQRGAGSKDTWVLSDGPISTFSMLRPPTQPVRLSRGGSDLPSRAADNLFWLGRYAERADSIARLGRALGLRVAEQNAGRLPEGNELRALFRALAAHTLATPVVAAAMETDPPERVLREALFGADRPGTLREVVRATCRTGGVIRDRISMDTWRILTELDRQARDAERGEARRGPGGVAARLDRMISTLAAFSGLAMDSMTRGDGWRFLDMGRRLERAANIAVLLGETLLTAGEREGPLLEAVLEVADSGITYRRRYLASLQPAPVADLLMVDETNPRSVAFQLASLGDHLAQLPRERSSAYRASDERLVLASLSRLRLADVETLSAPDADGRRAGLAALITELRRDLPALSDALTSSYFNHVAVSRQLAAAGGES
jgi:uncharacterized circularly permuted ATP-grasp superfamily protein/uncharacterized alpha-E superfamily protein